MKQTKKSKNKKNVSVRRTHQRLNRNQIADLSAATLLVFSVFVLIGIVILAFRTSPPKTADPVAISEPSTSVVSPTEEQTTPPAAQGAVKPSQMQSSPPESSRLDTTNTHTYLLRFSSEGARLSFLEANDIRSDQLTYLPSLGIYSTQLDSPIMTSGAQGYSNMSYEALLTPTDPIYSSQWHLPITQAPAAWNEQTGTPQIVTAVIDTGFALTHEDLASRWSTNANETGVSTSEGPTPNCSSQSLPITKSCNNIDDDNDGYVDNYLGWNFVSNNKNTQTGRVSPTASGVSHGTMVAGIIGASANNTKGGAGGNWNTKILPVQVLDDTGSGTTLSVSLGIRYAVDHGAKVINMSLGSDGSDTILEEQVQYALAHGVTVVAAAGNDGCDCILYPARYAGVISVGATNSSNISASFSSYGTSLSLVAPGTNICSTAWSSSNTTGLYACGNGTSFASPIVAAAAGLLISQDSTLTPTQIKSALTSSATKLAAMNGSTKTDQYGYGLLNMNAALSSISAPAPTSTVVSTHAISLQAPSSSTLNDALNTTCSPAQSSSCRIRAINTSTNEIIEIGTAPADTPLNLYWSAQAKNLAVGSWTIQVYAVTNTSKTLVHSEVLSISP